MRIHILSDLHLEFARNTVGLRFKIADAPCWQVSTFIPARIG